MADLTFGESPVKFSPTMAEPTSQRRQYVNFFFYKVDPLWGRLSEEEREGGRQELAQVVQQFSERMRIQSYSTIGLRADCDLMFWRISPNLENLQRMSVEVRKTGMGKYLIPAYSFLSMTKRSMYVDKHQHEGQEGDRLTVVPGNAKYLFVYPFVKNKAWYRLSQEERQKAMDEHIEIGHKYPSVKLNTTYSYGLDDQEFVLAFEGDKPEDFVDLVMELRFSKATSYTERDTPIFTCVRKGIAEMLQDF